MKITRRSVLILLFCLLVTQPAVPQTPNQKFLVFVGTDKTDSKGIYAYEFDASTGKLAPKGLAADTSNPSWLVIHPNGKWAYAANESGKQSTISAFSVDAKSAKLTLLNKLPAAGEDPCYLSFDKTGKFLFVANYTSGNVVVFPILPDGKLGKHTALVKDAGTPGPNKERQEGPHAHWIESSPDNRSVLVADLGLDQILIYPFDPNTGAFKRDGYESVHHFNVVPGSGPRHLTFLPEKKWLFEIDELNSTVSWFLYDPLRAWLNEVSKRPTLPKDFHGRNDAAEIAVHPTGKWLFASNRGHDSLAVFAIDPANGTLRPAGEFPTGGKEPRHFAIGPTGHFLLAENQNSNSIVVFRINPATGALSQIAIAEGIPSPVCLVFFPAH